MNTEYPNAYKTLYNYTNSHVQYVNIPLALAAVSNYICLDTEHMLI